MERVNLHHYGFSVIEIETMSVCNMSCSFCAYPQRADKGMTLPDQSVREIIDSIEADKHFEYICFNQLNEPLMDPRIYDFIRYAKARGLPVLLITNGLLFQSSEIIGKLIDASPDHVKISLQILNADAYRKSRSANISFGKYKEGIFNYLKSAAGGASHIVIDLACNFLSKGRLLRSVVLGLEQGDPSVYTGVGDLGREIKVFLKELREAYPAFAFDDGSVEDYLDTLKKDYSSQREFRIASNISIKVKPFFYGRRLAEFYPVRTAPKCSNRILGVLASGSVVPCCLAYGDLLSMGNVKTDPLKAILDRNTGFLTSIRQGSSPSLFCRRCMGAPTKRGAFVKDVRNVLSRLAGAGKSI